MLQGSLSLHWKRCCHCTQEVSSEIAHHAHCFADSMSDFLFYFYFLNEPNVCESSLTISFALQVPVLPTAGSFQQLHPLSFGEGIAFDPLPPKEIRLVGFEVTCSLQY